MGGPAAKRRKRVSGESPGIPLFLQGEPLVYGIMPESEVFK